MPHWPNGSEAEEAVDGKYIVDADDLIIGFETNPVTMTIDEARKLYPNDPRLVNWPDTLPTDG